MGHNGEVTNGMNGPEDRSFLLNTPSKALTLFPNLEYKINAKIDVNEVIDLYKSAGLNRPVHDVPRIAEMYLNSNLIISAWEGDLLVGVARSLTDFAYCCYCSDLAIRKEYQKGGIGKGLLRRTKELVGERTNLMLLAAPTAMEYYPKIGFSKIENGFIVKRLVD